MTSPFGSRGFALTLALALAPLGCTLDTGHVRLARPHVYDSATTDEQLAASGERVTEKIRKEADLETTQEASSRAETTALSLRAGGQGAAPGAEPGTPTLPAAAAVQNAAVGGVVAEAAKSFGRTIDEQINDIVHAESQTLETHLLYSGKGNVDLGTDARIYLVRFDIGVLPTRQSLYTYPWWAVQSKLSTVYRFTESWSARVDFELPPHLCGSSGLVYVYDVDPRFGVTTALDSVANVNQLQLAASYVAPGGAAALDYLNRLEEQFAQQRRYPLQLGFVDGPCRFTWVFGPRRVVQKRGPVRFVPFVSDYEVQSRLEPGTRTGHAVIVVPNQKDLSEEKRNNAQAFTCPPDRAPASSPAPSKGLAFEDLDTELTDQTAAHDAGGRDDEEDAARPSSAAPEGVARLCLRAAAHYIQLDQQRYGVPVPMSSPVGSGVTETVHVALDLPLSPPPKDEKEPLVLSLADPVGEHFVATASLRGDCGENCFSLGKAPTLVLLDEKRKEPLQIAEVFETSKQHVKASFHLPRKPESGSRVEIGATVESGGKRWKTKQAASYDGPPWGPEPVVLSCSGGSSVGSIVQLDLHGFVADAIQRIEVGLVALPPGPATAGWSVANEGRTVRFTVPRQPRKNADVEPPKEGSVVDVSVYLKDKRVHRAAGGLTYASAKRCLP